MLAGILLSAVLLIALLFIPVSGVLRLCLYLGVYLIIGYDILKKAVKGILNGRVFDEKRNLSHCDYKQPPLGGSCKDSVRLSKERDPDLYYGRL